MFSEKIEVPPNDDRIIKEISAYSLNNCITELADFVEIEVDSNWHEITHIASYQVVDGVWHSFNGRILIELDEKQILINEWQTVKIRYLP